tara:strand:- start:1144 stop:2124 length:981 start_codon:yes stop_codon:yes gene_type:complete
MTENNQTCLSVVIPAFNESESIIELFSRLEKVVSNFDYKLQVIYVDDGSNDDTKEVIRSVKSSIIDEILYVPLKRNMGKSEALMAGASIAKHPLLITMDADLQDLPEEFPNLIKKLNEGYDLVSGWKKKRNDPMLGKKIPSYFFNKLVKYLLKLDIHDINCGLKIYKTEIWSEINVYGDFHRFIPALASSHGYLIGEVAVEHHERKSGVSKYGPGRFSRGIFDLLTVFFLTTFAKRPLHFFGKLGGFFLIFGIVTGLYLTLIWFGGASIGSRPLLLLSTLLTGIGIQIILFGILSQLLVDVTKKDKNQLNDSVELVTIKNSEEIKI